VRKKNNANPIRHSAANPPTVPPTIAPVGVLEFAAWVLTPTGEPDDDDDMIVELVDITGGRLVDFTGGCVLDPEGLYVVVGPSAGCSGRPPCSFAVSETNVSFTVTFMNAQ